MAGTWSCEACGAAGQPVTGRQATAFTAFAGAEAFHHPPYHVCGCAQCGAWQKTARLGEAELDRYYARLEHESFESARLMPPDRLIVAAADALPAGSRILDYGCGIGRTLALCAARHACLGVEPNARSAAVAAGRGITLVDEAELETRLAGSIDMVVLADVYEHLLRPLEVVRALAACLKPGGMLWLLTGYADRVSPPELLAEFWYFRVAGHLRMVSERHLGWLARSSGLELRSQHALSHYDPDLLRDAMQRFRLWAYAATHLRPSGAAARLVAHVPVVRRAAAWSNAPMLSCGADHVMAVFGKSGEAPR